MNILSTWLLATQLVAIFAICSLETDAATHLRQAVPSSTGPSQSTASPGPCPPLDGIFVKKSGPPKLSGNFNFTSTNFDMNLSYAGTPYTVENIPYTMIDEIAAEQGCWVHVDLSVIYKMPKKVREDVGVALIFFYKNLLYLPTKFGGPKSLARATFTRQEAL
ncbi:hypothetical protein Pmar_PMAR000676 [Perkinsus marinus ATCC 50983]|uniref:Uncharacterized protein n=1 Tax=Perkinsus marinus (strain ATCC 50983 / TXsc) TaxID=423536 RepID=C5KRG7_PERM5|nr:hypothetical protein Pmar_PMAR000676 [Perkinsus marinus ATCC 50983]EER12940.1 hypothetical protein Pmar_PMAR000676 [Perkinsus marinus ATCC 50983]|eukprot:XP_002781145.1 hypothetical protein Pmar_PMAR000676 [Perkinsus marinus ATCC 50983]